MTLNFAIEPVLSVNNLYLSAVLVKMLILQVGVGQDAKNVLKSQKTARSLMREPGRAGLIILNAIRKGIG
jgi:hypothetical protein